MSSNNLNIKNENGRLCVYDGEVNILAKNESMNEVHWVPMTRKFDFELIKKNETALEIKLPNAYFNFLQACNGSTPSTADDLNLVGVHCHTRLGGLSEFIFPYETYIEPDDINIIAEIEEAQYFLDGEPMEITRKINSIQLFPICSCNGNLICFDFSQDKNNPAVVFADIEDGSLFPIAEDFRQYLSMLTPSGDPDSVTYIGA